MVANAVGKGYSEVECAYLAGFLDADGAIMALIEKHDEKKFGFRVRIEVKITQKGITQLLSFQKVFSVGKVKENRHVYDWRIRNQSDVAHILSLVRPYVRVKNQQVLLAQKILKININSKQDLLTAAQLADTLSKFNVRSVNRRQNYASKIQEYLSCND